MTDQYDEKTRVERAWKRARFYVVDYPAPEHGGSPNEVIEDVIDNMDEAIAALREAAGPPATVPSDLARFRAALEKINEIRNDIIGRQGGGGMHWSKHIYPLVEVLEDAGFEGDGYDIARERAAQELQNIQTNIDQAVAAEREKRRALVDVCERLCDAIDREEHDIGGESSGSVLEELGSALQAAAIQEGGDDKT